MFPAFYETDPFRAGGENIVEIEWRGMEPATVDVGRHSHVSEGQLMCVEHLYEID